MKKIAFATCVQLGRSCIEEVYQIGGQFDLLITLEDNKDTNKSGRVYIDDLAQKKNTELLKINNINDKIVVNKLKEKEIDWLFIIGWSQIAKKEILQTPKKGCIGMHPTLLPMGRGRAAIPWTILKGFTETGVTLFQLDEGVDTGDIIAQEKISISNTITATELYKIVDDLHIKLISKHWQNINEDTIVLRKQDHQKATIWEGRKPEDGEIRIDFTMEEADAMVRAVTKPYPGAFYVENGKKYIVWSADFSKEKGDYKLKNGYLQLKDYEAQEA